MICAGDTKKRGACIPPISTVVFAKLVGRGKASAATVEADKFVPKMEMIEPGDKETGAGAKLAPLTIPACGTRAVPTENTVKLAANGVAGTVAVTVIEPDAAPNKTVTEAFPCASVFGEAAVREASPCSTANSTGTPAKGI